MKHVRGLACVIVIGFMMFPSAALGITVTESGDAGELQDTAQAIFGTEPINFITGTFSNNNDVDLYAIQVDGGPFLASTVGQSPQPPFTADTRLYLFNASGLGVVANDNWPGTFRSAISATLPAGIYFLGIATGCGPSGRNPISVAGLIFPALDCNFAQQVGPAVPGGASPLSGWTGSGCCAGPYTIFLSGASAVSKPIVLTSSALPLATLDAPYTLQLRAAPSQGLSWSIVDGSLPNGIILSPSGLLTGTPTEAGSFTFTLAAAATGSLTAEMSFALDVLLIPPLPSIRIRKVGTAPVPGRTLDYFIVVENQSVSPAQNVHVIEILETWFTLLSTSPSAASVRQTVDLFPIAGPRRDFDAVLEWVIPTLEPGGARVFSYKVVLDPLFPRGELVSGFACSPINPLPDPLPSPCELTFYGCRKKAYNDCEAVAPDQRTNCVISKDADCYEEFKRCECSQGFPRCSTLEAGLLTTTPFCSSDRRPAQTPVDPNEKLSIAKKFIRPDQLLVYPIHFQNIGDINAQDVFVTDVLDPALDESTVSILTPQGASFDLATRTLKWSLLGLNLAPGATGNVLFSIKPKSDTPSGTIIRNKATIQFEVFTPLDTNQVENTVDSTRPTCLVSPLPSTITTPTFTVSWVVSDTLGEVDSVSVLVSVDGGAFVPFVTNTKEANSEFAGAVGQSYGFLCVATDTAENVEVKAAVAEATTLVVQADVTPPTVSITSPSDGATFTRNQAVNAAYTCSDEPGGSGISSCTGPVPSGSTIDTATVGDRTFTVVAQDVAGNSTTMTHAYKVLAPSGTICSTLGVDGGLDEDVFRFDGVRGEQVTIHLTRDPAGTSQGQRATLSLMDPIRGMVPLAVERDVLPNQITARLTASGRDLVRVAEQPGDGFRGAYCLSLDASDKTKATLAAHSGVE